MDIADIFYLTIALAGACGFSGGFLLGLRFGRREKKPSTKEEQTEQEPKVKTESFI